MHIFALILSRFFNKVRSQILIALHRRILFSVFFDWTAGSLYFCKNCTLKNFRNFQIEKKQRQT